MIGPQQLLLWAVQADIAQRPPEDVVGNGTEQVGVLLEEVGTHADVLDSLAGEENGVCHGFQTPSSAHRVTGRPGRL